MKRHLKTDRGVPEKVPEGPKRRAEMSPAVRGISRTAGGASAISGILIGIVTVDDVLGVALVGVVP
jgi:hypothetical protein